MQIMCRVPMIKKVLVFCVFCLAPSVASAGDPEPAPLPSFVVGDEFGYTTGDDDNIVTVVSIDGDAIHWKNNHGMNFSMTRSYLHRGFEWSGNHSGTLKTTSGDPLSLWPLEVGKSVTVWRKGLNKDTGKRWKEKYKCTVEAFETVGVEAGEFDAYKVACSTGWRSYTYYHAPEIGYYVKMYYKYKNESKTYELMYFNKEQ